MARKGKRLWIVWASSLALFCLLCRAFPAFLCQRLSHPLTMALHRLTARVPFPVSELATFAVGFAALLALISEAFRAILRRRMEPLLRWLRGVAAAALALSTLLVVAWLPAMFAPTDLPPEPDAGQLAWLCEVLVDRLNAAPLDFPESAEALRRAPGVAGLPDCMVKAARYPEWMRAGGVSGLFAPPTGEAVVDATAPAALVPFTAVHELMHLRGIADEGAANIAAWQRCADAGGAFEDSARLWALRYAAGLLARDDPDAWARIRGNMKDPLARVFGQSGGEIVPASGTAGLPGLSRVRGDYAALAYWLAGK